MGFAQTAAVRRICRDVFMLAVFPFAVSQSHHPLQNTCIVRVARWALLLKLPSLFCPLGPDLYSVLHSVYTMHSHDLRKPSGLRPPSEDLNNGCPYMHLVRALSSLCRISLDPDYNFRSTLNFALTEEETLLYTVRRRTALPSLARQCPWVGAGSKES